MTEPTTQAAEKETKRETWRDLLRPWSDRYADLAADLAAHVQTLDDKALNTLGLATARPTETNVYWATYAVAPLVRDAVRSEQYRRHQQRKSPARDCTCGSGDERFPDAHATLCPKFTDLRKSPVSRGSESDA